MKIKAVRANPDWTLSVVAEDGRAGVFDARPYLDFEAFQALRGLDAFARVSHGGYFVEWECGADLSADTIEAEWQLRAEAALAA